MADRTEKTEHNPKAEHNSRADHISKAEHNPKIDPAPNSNTVKDPDNWTTGGEPMTGAQASYLKTLTEQTGGEFDESLNKAEASKRIDSLRGEAGLAKK